MTIANPRFIGDEIKTGTALARVAGTVGSNNGTAINRLAAANGGIPLSATFTVVREATTGSPSAQTLDAKVQHSSDNSTWADYTDPSTGATAAMTQDTAATAGSSELNVDLSKANQYIRLVTTTAFTSGTSPATPHNATYALGGYTVTPN